MPAANLILPGFYGKLPTAGDFVTRRLPTGFVQPWDRWLSRHLAPLLHSGLWDQRIALRFLTGPTAFGSVAGSALGLVVPSADRVGRQFPLSIVALLPQTSETISSEMTPTPNPSPQGGGGQAASPLGFNLQRLCTVSLQPETPSPLWGGVRGGGIAEEWFAQLEKIARTAQAGELSPDCLDEVLTTLPLPSLNIGETLDGMAIWTEGQDLHRIDPDAPRTILESLLAPSWETS